MKHFYHHNMMMNLLPFIIIQHLAMTKILLGEKPKSLLVPILQITTTAGADPGFDQGGPQIVTGLNCQWCAAASCKQSEPFSV